MADSKLTELPEDTAPDATDIIYEVQDPSGTPASKKVQFVNVHKALTVFTGDSGAGGAKGLVPAPAAGDAAASKYLKADGSWTAITIPPSASYDYLSTLVNAEVSITGTDTASWGKQHVVSGSSDFTVTLQTCSGHTGEFMSFRITNTGVTTLDGNSSETIEGATTRKCYQGQTITLYCDGSNAHVINTHQPRRTTMIFADSMICSTAITLNVNTSQRYNMEVYQTSAANGNTADFIFDDLLPGTYTVSIHGKTGVNIAKLDWTFDSASIADAAATGQDWYSASTVFNVIKTFSLVVSNGGYHILRATVNGRNASNTTGYFFALTSINLSKAVF